MCSDSPTAVLRRGQGIYLSDIVFRACPRVLQMSSYWFLFRRQSRGKRSGEKRGRASFLWLGCGGVNHERSTVTRGYSGVEGRLETFLVFFRSLLLLF